MTTIIILSIIFLVIDQISKILIIKLLEPNEVITIIKNFFYIIYTNNTGAAFSILLGKRIFLIVVAILIIGILLYYIKKNKVDGKLNIIAFSLIIGGSLGNLIDRIVRGYVVDFISIKLGSYNFPIFNIADTLIVVGVFLRTLGRAMAVPRLAAEAAAVAEAPGGVRTATPAANRKTRKTGKRLWTRLKNMWTRWRRS